jgi:hypothetical protein
MRPVGITTGAIMAMLVLAASSRAAGPAHEASSACPPAHSHVIRSDRQAVVYTIREHATETLEGEHYRVYFTGIRGCVRGRARSYKLGAPPEQHGGAGGSAGSGTSNVALDGTDVAFEDSRTASGSEGSGEFHNEWFVVVRDLRNGRVLHKVPTGPARASDSRNVGVGPTTALVVKSDGAVAWIAEAPGVYEVRALDTTGTRLLAAAGDIKPYALGLKDNRLYWTRGAKRMSAVLR